MKYSDVVNLLGYEGKDRITKQSGVISSIAFDLYGCIQVLLTPLKVENNTDIKVQGWFDINRIEIKKGKKIMEAYYFETKYEHFNDTGGPENNKPLK